jgi:hypothetical protein
MSAAFVEKRTPRASDLQAVVGIPKHVLDTLPDGMRLVQSNPLPDLIPNLPTLFVAEQGQKISITAVHKDDTATVVFPTNKPDGMIAKVYLQNPREVLITHDFAVNDPGLQSAALPTEIATTRNRLTRKLGFDTSSPIFEAKKSGKLSRLNANVVFIEPDTAHGDEALYPEIELPRTESIPWGSRPGNPVRFVAKSVPKDHTKPEVKVIDKMKDIAPKREWTQQEKKAVATVLGSLQEGDENALTLVDIANVLWPDKNIMTLDHEQIIYVLKTVSKARYAIRDEKETRQILNATGYYFGLPEADHISPSADIDSPAPEAEAVAPRRMTPGALADGAIVFNPEIEALTESSLTMPELAILAWSLVDNESIKKTFLATRVPFFPSDAMIHEIVSLRGLPDDEGTDLVTDHIVPALIRAEEIVSQFSMMPSSDESIDTSHPVKHREAKINNWSLVVGLAMINQITFTNKEDRISGLAYIRELYTDPEKAKTRQPIKSDRQSALVHPETQVEFSKRLEDLHRSMPPQQG